MYNKLFTSILDSSVWLEQTTTRIVWVTLLAAMDEDGFVRMATVENLSSRARVTLEECEIAVRSLESPDRHCPEQEREGRRIERVDGGWMILNSKKYRDIVNHEKEKEQTRLRVARHRAKKACNGDVTAANEKVTLSATEAATATEGRGGASLPLLGQVMEVFDSWNTTADNLKLAKCLVLSDKRRRTLEARLRNVYFVANWRQALCKLASSEFCKGSNDRGWQASFDWFIQPDSVAKTMEGKYDNRSTSRQRPNPRLEGVSRNPINDYGAAAARKQQQQAERRLADEMAAAGNRAPSKAPRA